MFLLLFENRALNRVTFTREVRIATLTRHARRLATGVLGRVALTLLLARLITTTSAATITRSVTIAGAIAITGAITATGTVATTGAITAAIVVSTTATTITAAIPPSPSPGSLGGMTQVVPDHWAGGMHPFSSGLSGGSG
ncbi:hypothetical protein H5023_15585 [Pseudomonas aeruginosa]|uniref:hypothetical protein n=1 Tax=Pseudomonas aeruginosa TaxID=287 RepID=UPI003978A3DF